MPFYSEDLIEEVRSANDIVDVVSGYVKLTKKGSTWFGLCPFHNEKTPSFSVSRGKQMYYCFGCGAGGNVVTFLMQYENFTFPEAMQHLADRAGISLPKQELSEAGKKAADRRSKLLEINREAAKYYFHLLYSKRGERALSYFHERGLSDDTIRRFGLGYSDVYNDDLYRYLKNKGYSDDLLRGSGLISYREQKGAFDKFWNRAMFPIMDYNSRVIAFGGRVMGDGEPKYLNSPETEIFDKSRNLYGLNYARSSRRKGILLCEGYMDVIALHQAGFDNAVAALGTSFTSGHASLLKRYTDEVFLTFDSDNAGIKAALRAIPILKEAGITAKVINMNPYKDPDEFIKNLGADAYEERIRQAENSFLFEVRSLESDYNLDDPEEKTAFHKKIARMILRFPDELERENYITAIAEKYHTGFDNLRSLVRAEGTRGGIAVKKPPLKSGIKQPEKKDGIRLSQRLLLTWLVDEPDLFPTVMQYISPEDFTDPLYHEVAEEIYQQYKNGELHPVTIMNRFEEEDKQKEIAAIFHEKLPPFSTEQEKEVAFRDTIIKIKKNHIDTQMQQSTSLEQYQELIKEKQKLDMLRTRKLI